MSRGFNWERPELHVRGRIDQTRTPKPFTDAALKARAMRDAVSHQLRNEPNRKPMKIHIALAPHTQPCGGCQGVVRPGDRYVNRKTGPATTWEPWHDFCWSEH